MTGIQLSLLGGEQQTRTSDDYYTPRWIFDTMGITFDLDVACPPEGPINVPAARYYTAADDGLAQPWEGRVWMNPPYSRITPWVNRWLDHDNGLALVPYSKSNWFVRLWASDARAVDLYNLAFERATGEKATIRFPLALWALGDDCIEAIARLGKVR